jgi:hypothetical protein
MLVKFYDRRSGEHIKIGEAPMDAVPREGDTCMLKDGETKIVHSVMWDLTAMTVSLLLR